MLSAILIALAMVVPTTEVDLSSYQCRMEVLRKECNRYTDYSVWPCAMWCAYHEDVCRYHKACGSDTAHRGRWFSRCAAALGDTDEDDCAKLSCTFMKAREAKDPRYCAERQLLLLTDDNYFPPS